MAMGGNASQYEPRVPSVTVNNELVKTRGDDEEEEELDQTN